MMKRIRSLLYYLVSAPLTIPFSLIALIIYPLPYRWRFYIITRWTHLSLAWLKIICGLDFRVSGKEHIPAGPAVILCKHQSVWETMAMQLIFPPHVWIFKKEILWLPFFGWAISTLEPIAIDRGTAIKALKQVTREGVERLKNGRWILIFPEGTRVAPGQKGRYAQSGALLALKAGCPVVPVAHNAGVFWPRNNLVKQPGTIDVVIGETIDPVGKTAAEITEQVEAWIEQTVDKLNTGPKL